MIDKHAKHYLQEMDIDVWLTRKTVVSKPLVQASAWPLVIVIDSAVLQEHLELFKGIVSAMQLDWAAVHCTSAEHFPEGYQGWVLWADANSPAVNHAQLLSCNPEALANDRQAKRVLWQQICTQILNRS